MTEPSATPAPTTGARAPTPSATGPAPARRGALPSGARDALLWRLATCVRGDHAPIRPGARPICACCGAPWPCPPRRLAVRALRHCGATGRRRPGRERGQAS
jgi:hypothetical protein